LEFDHADIFDDLAAIERQFNHFVRIVPRRGLLVVNGQTKHWSECSQEELGRPSSGSECPPDGRPARRMPMAAQVAWQGASQGRLRWQQLGDHNRMNALAALAAARHVGVSAKEGSRRFHASRSAKAHAGARPRRRGNRDDDFAHHPTAIETT